MESFNMYKFISEIQEEPAIWDYKSEAYGNRLKKLNAWEKVCRTFHENFEELNAKEKNEVASSLQRKWKSLRDCFNRELKNLKKAGPGKGVLRRKKYIYFDQLLFLEPLAQQKEIASDDKELLSVDEIKPEEVTPKKLKPNKDEKLKVVKEKIIQKPIVETTSISHDEDTLFCLSLVNDFKKIVDDGKIDAKCEVLQVLNKYKRMSASNT